MKRKLTKLLMLCGVFLLLGATNASAGIYARWGSGSVNNWNPNYWESYDYEFKETYPNSGIYTVNLGNVKGDTQFKIFDNGYGDKWFGIDISSDIILGKEYTVSTSNDNNLKLGSDPINNVVITFKPKNSSWTELSVTVTGTIQNSPLYIIQDNGSEWLTNSGIELKGVNNIYTQRVELGYPSGFARFQIVEKLGNTVNDWNNVGTQYQPKTGNGQRDEDRSNFYFEGSSKITQEASVKNTGGYGDFVLPSGTYDLTFNKNDMTLSVKLVSLNFPEYLYMYGDVNASKWDVTENPYVAKGDNGVYKFERVSIYGNNDDENHNYFSFFYHRDDSDNSYTKQLPRVTSLEGYNDQGGGHNHEFGTLERGKEYRADASVHCFNQVKSVDEYNFKVDKGYYDVTVDLNVPEVRIKLHDPLVFDWHNGSGDMLNGNKDFEDDPDTDYTHRDDSDDIYGEYEVTYSPDGRRVQVGVEGDAKHDAANKATFNVWRKISESAVAQKRNASEIATYATAPTGYTSATEGTDYNIEPGNVVVLKQAGEYKVDAYLDPSLKEVYLTDAATTLDVKVNPVQIALVENSDAIIYQAFSNATNGNVLPVALTSTTTIIPAKYITVALNPVDGDNWPISWEKLPEGHEYLEDEAAQISGRFDGLYSEITSKQISVAEGSSDGNYNISVQFPCSGVYTMTLGSSNTNYTLNEELQVIIYPTVMNTYTQNGSTGQLVSGKFNVNGITYTPSKVDYKGIIEYPIIDSEIFMQSSLANSQIYTPGLYFADMKIYTPSSPSNINGKRRASDTTITTSDESLSKDYTSYVVADRSFDLSDLGTGTAPKDVVLYVYVSKNGAFAPITNGNSEENFLIKASTTAPLPTGVDAIGSEAEGEAVYYNLQGVKVDNPEKGIYVKVQNGKASKVVF